MHSSFFPSLAGATLHDHSKCLLNLSLLLLNNTGSPSVVRYQRDSVSSGPERLARKLHDELSHLSGGSSSKARGLLQGNSPVTLLVVERSLDLCAPLVHEYSYEALVYDVLDDPHRFGLDVEAGIMASCRDKKESSSDGGRSHDGGGREQHKADLKPLDRSSGIVLSDDLWELLRHRHFYAVTK